MIHHSQERLVLLEAAKIVRERWGQGMDAYAHNSNTKPCCIIKAIDVASQRAMPLTISWVKMMNAVSSRAGDPNSLASWNDKPGRTAEEVASVLSLAAGDV